MARERRDNTLTGLGTERKPRFGRYQVVRKISEGATSLIFVAKTDHPAGFEKVAALKVIRPELVEDPRRIDTFLKEARLSARIDHANVCSVFDFGEENGYYYIAMEYLVGETLTTIFETMRAQGLASEAATHRMIARIVAHACEGLHAAHELTDEQGRHLSVVHRDVCPDNIIVTFDGQVRVVDFGLARAALDDGDFDALAKNNHLPYLAPEQARGLELDRRADVWSLGTILWEGLAGRRLFDGTTRNEIVFQMASQDIRSPEGVRWPVADVFAQCALRALHREVEERYVDARTMGERLELALQATGASLGAAAVSTWMNAMFPGRAERKRRLLSSIPPPVPPEARHPPYDDDPNQIATAIAIETSTSRNESTTRKKQLPTDTREGAVDRADTQTLNVRGMVAPSPRVRRVTPDHFEDPDTSTFAGVSSKPAPRKTQSLSRALGSQWEPIAPEVTHEIENEDLEELETAEDAAQVPLPKASIAPPARRPTPPKPQNATRGGLPTLPLEVEPAALRPSRRVPWLFLTFLLFFVGVGAALAVFRHDLEALLTGRSDKLDVSQTKPTSMDQSAAVAPSFDASAAVLNVGNPRDSGSRDSGGDAAAVLADEVSVARNRRPKKRQSTRRSAAAGRTRRAAEKRSKDPGRDWIVDPNSEESTASKADKTPKAESGNWIVDPSSADEPKKKDPVDSEQKESDGIDWIVD